MHDINFKGIHIRTIFDLTYLIKKSNDMVSQMARSKVTLPFNGAKLFNSFENEFKNGLNYSKFKAKLKTIVYGEECSCNNCPYCRPMLL